MEATKTTICPGSGKHGVEGAGSLLYAHCPECGREFSTQSGKERTRWGNPWLSIPRHFTR